MSKGPNKKSVMSRVCYLDGKRKVVPSKEYAAFCAEYPPERRVNPHAKKPVGTTNPKPNDEPVTGGRTGGGVDGSSDGTLGAGSVDGKTTSDPFAELFNDSRNAQDPGGPDNPGRDLGAEGPKTELVATPTPAPVGGAVAPKPRDYGKYRKIIAAMLGGFSRGQATIIEMSSKGQLTATEFTRSESDELSYAVVEYLDDPTTPEIPPWLVFVATWCGVSSQHIRPRGKKEEPHAQ